MSERLLTILLGGVILGLLFFGFRDSVPASFLQLIPGEHAHASAARYLEPNAAQEPAARPSRKPTRPDNPGKSAAQAAPAPQVPVRDIIVQLPPSLTPADVRPSMSRTELEEKFGPPDLSAEWSDSGKMNEKLFYSAGRSPVEVTVQNGRVVVSRAVE